MARQYNNAKTYLASVGYSLTISLDDFIETKNVIFSCKNNHSTTLVVGSYINKKSKCKKNPEDLCTECVNDKFKKDRFETEKKKILESTGHTLVSLKDRENAIYICGNCGKENDTWLSCLHTNKGCCPHCQNEKFKNKEEDVIERLKKAGVSLVEYKDCHNVKIKCQCGNQFITSLYDIKRGRLCPECKLDRTKKTNLIRYGVENPFQSKEIKEKIKAVCLEKYGVEHHLKNKDILEKVKKTNLDKYGVQYIFHTKEAVKKAKETMIKKYGVEFPLQSEFVQAKIRQTFLNTIGYEYPLLSPELRTIYLQRSKEEITKKYGVDSYFKSDEFMTNYPIYWQRSRETCLDKYGVDFPMQHPSVFSKQQKSSFLKKKYIFPSGRVAYVMGYEPECIDLLLNDYKEDEIIVETVDIPTIDYINTKEQKAVYYPDIMLPDKLIEVKSTYTYNKDLDNNKRKFKACVKKGYNIDVWIFNGKKKLITIISYSKNGPVMEIDMSE